MAELIDRQLLYVCATHAADIEEAAVGRAGHVAAAEVDGAVEAAVWSQPELN